MYQALFPVLLANLTDAAVKAQIRVALAMLIVFVLSIAVHEYGHALVADKLGDNTPRSQGRVTLNPLAHADIIGTIVMPLLGVFLGGFVIGWGKPVMVSPFSFTRKLRMKTAHLFVALAGPMMNVALALLVTGLVHALVATGVLSPMSELAKAIKYIVYLNWLLFFFNLIPCPPLDGGAVLAGLLPDSAQPVNDFLQQYGFIILLGLFISGALGWLLFPAAWLAHMSVPMIPFPSLR